MWETRINNRRVRAAYLQTENGLREIRDFYSVTETGTRRWKKVSEGVFQFELTVIPASFPFNFEITGAEILIDWGDGAALRIVRTPEELYALSHTYQTGTYVVTVQGDIQSLRFLGLWGNANNALSRILTPFPATIRKIGRATFQFASNLASIPAGLFDSCAEAADFTSCFQLTKLKAIPVGLFDRCTKASCFRNCFLGCGSLTGTAPKLWELFPDADGSGCFGGCTGLSNYGDIPDAWK